MYYEILKYKDTLQTGDEIKGIGNKYHPIKPTLIGLAVSYEDVVKLKFRRKVGNMKTLLPDGFAKKQDAIYLLEQLVKNNEAFHPEDDPFMVDWQTCNPTDGEKERLNILMRLMYKNFFPAFDPCDVVAPAFLVPSKGR